MRFTIYNNEFESHLIYSFCFRVFYSQVVFIWSNSQSTTLQTQGRSSSKLSQWLSSTLSILDFLWEWRSFLLCTRAPHFVEYIFVTKHFVLFTNREWSFSYNGESNSYSKSACISHTVLDDHCSQFESHLTWTLCSG